MLEDDFGGLVDSDTKPDNVIPFPTMRANAKLSEAWGSELELQNKKLSSQDKFLSPLAVVDDIIRRRSLPVMPWPAAWPEMGRRCRAYAGDCVAVTGPTGAGKTSFAIQIARAAMGEGIPVLWCPLELDATQITERIVANMHGVHAMAVKDHWSRERIAHSLAAVDDMWRFVDRKMDPDEQRSALMRAITLVSRIYRIRPLIVIDYLGKLASMARDTRIATIQAVEHLRGISVDAECYTLILAQPSRAKNAALTGRVEHGSATETSGSAGESGEVENAAAVEINLEVFKVDDAMELDARAHVAKSRWAGGEGQVGMRFSKPGGVWTELDYLPAHPIATKAHVERAKKDKHRTEPAPSMDEARRELNVAAAGDADAARRVRILDAIGRHGMLGMDQNEMRKLPGTGRMPQVHEALQELARVGTVERAPNGRWRLIPR